MAITIYIDLYKNWKKYSEQYKIAGFYDVNKINFLKNLTNFVYSFTKNQNMTREVQNLKVNVKDLNLISLNWEKMKVPETIQVQENKWQKLGDEKTAKYVYLSSFPGKSKTLLVIDKYTVSGDWEIRISAGDTAVVTPDEIWYVWTGDKPPNLPKIDEKTGQILDWNENIKN